MACVAGEPVQGLLTPPLRTAPGDGLASGPLGETTRLLGEVLLLFLCGSVAATTLASPSPLARLWLLVVLAGIFVQGRRCSAGARGRRGRFASDRGGSGRARSPGRRRSTRGVGRTSASQPADFALLTLLAFLGWLVGAGEEAVW